MANVITNLNDVPKPGQNLQNTRDPINANFAAIDTAFTVNHVSYDLTGGADQGKHILVQMVNNAAMFTMGAQEFAFFSNGGALKFARPTETQATALNVTTTVNNPVNGYFKLLNGITVKYGRLTATGAQTIAFPTGGGVPAFTSTPLIVICTPVQSGTALTGQQVVWNYNSTSATNLAVVCTNGAGAAAAVQFDFLAIGFSAN